MNDRKIFAAKRAVKILTALGKNSNDGTFSLRDPSMTNHWGRDDIMALAAVRYCLGRMTYIVSDCADWLPTVWPHLSEDTRHVIQRDVEEEFERDDRARAEGGTYLPLGMDMDRRQWERVRKLWTTK